MIAHVPVEVVQVSTHDLFLRIVSLDYLQGLGILKESLSGLLEVIHLIKNLLGQSSGNLLRVVLEILVSLEDLALFEVPYDSIVALNYVLRG